VAIVGPDLTALAIDLPDRRGFSAKPFGRIIDRAEREFASALAKLGKGNAAPAGERCLLVDGVGCVAHSVFAFLSRTPGPLPFSSKKITP
jgi:hypothetical protein